MSAGLAGEAVALMHLPVRGMTCGSCAARVRRALEQVPGVVSAEVNFSGGVASISFYPMSTDIDRLYQAVQTAGYETSEQQPVRRVQPSAPAPRGWILPAVAGLAGAIALSGFYLGIVTLAQGWAHATQLFFGDWYFVVPIILGFGIQIGLFTWVRWGGHRPGGSSSLVAEVGTGTSTVSMLACCAHHLADVLPVMGVSGAALFLNEYRTPLLLFGVVANLAGIALMLRVVRRCSRREYAVA